MHGYAGADARSVVALAEEEVHTADGKLETRLVGAGDGRDSLGLSTTGSALACLTRPGSEEVPSALTSSLLSRLRVQTGSAVFLPRRPAPSAWALALFCTVVVHQNGWARLPFVQVQLPAAHSTTMIVISCVDVCDVMDNINVPLYCMQRKRENVYYDSHQ